MPFATVTWTFAPTRYSPASSLTDTSPFAIGTGVPDAPTGPGAGAGTPMVGLAVTEVASALPDPPAGTDSLVAGGAPAPLSAPHPDIAVNTPIAASAASLDDHGRRLIRCLNSHRRSTLGRSRPPMRLRAQN